MKDYKLLLAGLFLLLLVVLIGVLSWLWLHNRKNIDPLPILSREESQSIAESLEEESDEVKNNTEANTLYIQAQQPLQVPLDDIIVSFEARYPHVQVLTNYVPAAELLTLDNSNATDLVIADAKLSDSLLSSLQQELNANIKNNTVDAAQISSEQIDQDNPQNTAEQTPTRTLNPFNYALKNSQAVEGVILSDKAVAISFRNFMISSTGQDILKKYEFSNIEGYQNSVDDLFNPTSRGKTAVEETEIISDALTNNEE